MLSKNVKRCSNNKINIVLCLFEEKYFKIFLQLSKFYRKERCHGVAPALSCFK